MVRTPHFSPPTGTLSPVTGERLRFYNGRFVVGYTLNNALYPDTPVLQVTAGDLVDLTIINRSGLDHPMHLHGHHALVLQRDDQPTTGSPWWVDTATTSNTPPTA